MYTCLTRIATTLALIGVFAVGCSLAVAQHGGMIAPCVL